MTGYDLVTHPFTTTLIRIKASRLCRRHDFSRSDFDDLRQEMRLYLLEHAHQYDPARGNLDSYVKKAINTWVAMELRRRWRLKRCPDCNVVSLERTPVECDGDITSLGAVLMEDDGCRLLQTVIISNLDQFELKEALQHALAALDPFDRALLDQVAEQGVTRTARACGITRRQVEKVLARIREFFEKSGLGGK